jgi:hypothetical protein
MPVPAIQQERILQHAWHLKKNGYRESTITGRVKLLRSLARRVDLFDPEGVKGTIALLNVSEGRKEMLSCGYLCFSRQFDLPYMPPRYQRIEKLPFIPLETEIDQLIAAMGKRWASYLQLLKETGVRQDTALISHRSLMNHGVYPEPMPGHRPNAIAMMKTPITHNIHQAGPDMPTSSVCNSPSTHLLRAILSSTTNAIVPRRTEPNST